MLLEEIIKFDKERNFDRVIAAELAIALANKLNPVIKINSLSEDNRVQAYFDRAKNKGKNKSIFSGLTVKGTKVRQYNKRSKLFL